MPHPLPHRHRRHASTFTPERIAAHGSRPRSRTRSVEMFLKNGLQVADLLPSGVLAALPRLEVRVGREPASAGSRSCSRPSTTASSKAGSRRHPEWEKRPSEYFDQVYSCYWFEQVAPRRPARRDRRRPHPVRDRLPAPHLPLRRRRAPAIANGLGDSDEETRRKILWGNGQSSTRSRSPPRPTRRSSPRSAADVLFPGLLPDPIAARLPRGRTAASCFALLAPSAAPAGHCSAIAQLGS